MAEMLTLMEFVDLLSASDSVQSDFAADPHATLTAYGLDDLSPADVQDAIALVEENHTVDWSDAYGAGAGPDLSDDSAFGSGSGSGSVGDTHAGGTDATVTPADAVASPYDGPDAWGSPDPDDGLVPDPDPGPTLDDVLHDAADLHLG